MPLSSWGMICISHFLSGLETPFCSVLRTTRLLSVCSFIFLAPSLDMKSDKKWLFGHFWLFLLPWCFQALSSGMCHLVSLPYFLLQIIFPMWSCHTMSLKPFFDVDDHVGVFILEQLWIMLPQMLMYTLLCEHLFSILLGMYLEVEMLGYVVILGLTFWENMKLPCKAAAPFHFY